MTATETRDDALRRGLQEGAASSDAPYLILALECDRPHAGPARFSLEGVDEVRIGRGAERGASRDASGGRACLHVRVPDAMMSTTHVKLVRHRHAALHGSWVVADQDSRNGTFLNGSKISGGSVGAGDLLEAGRTVFFLAVLAGEGSPDLDAAADLAGAPVGLRTLLPDVAARFDKLTRIAASKVPVLLLGETGTGKEVLARAVHAASGRRGPFVAVNCGALPSGLVEALLFGHVRGAFSGALRDEVGYVRAAHEGTLFLDEVGELPRAAQAALLRVLQDGEVLPIGRAQTIAVDTRIVAATNRAIDDENAFRADLHARLAGFTFSLPPLRGRVADIGLILADLLRARAGDGALRYSLTPDLAIALLRHGWPKNVRELEQYLSAAMVLAADGVLRMEHFPIAPKPPPRDAEPREQASLDVDAQRLRDAVIAEMRAQRGNVAAVARAMGKRPTQIQRWLTRFGLDPHVFRRRG